MNAVDTNILVYALDDDEPEKRAKANSLIDRLVKPPAESILLWQAAAELLSCLRKWKSAGRISAADVEAHFRDIRSMFPLRVPSATVFDIAIDMHARYSLSHWDGMLLAACKDAAVDTLYSEDFDSGTDYDGIKVVNPLL